MPTRRDFLKFGLQAAAIPHLLGCSSLPRVFRSGKGKIAIPSKDCSDFTIFDWDTHELRTVQLPLEFTHSALQNPIYRNEILIFEQFGPRSLILDLKTLSVIHEAKRDMGRSFYGHGAITPDGRWLVSTESSYSLRSSHEGVLSIRDARTLEVATVIPSFGVKPHDICFLDSDVLAVSNQGRDATPSNISFISLRSRNLIKKVEIPRHRGFCHMLKLNESSVFVAATDFEMPHDPESEALNTEIRNGGPEAPAAIRKLRDRLKFLPAPMYLVSRTGEISAVWDKLHPEYFNYNFSLCFVSKVNSTVASAHIGSNAVTLWQNNKILRRIETPDMAPAAVATSRDETELLISGGGQFRFYSTTDFKEIKKKSFRLKRGAVHVSLIS